MNVSLAFESEIYQENCLLNAEKYNYNLSYCDSIQLQERRTQCNAGELNCLPEMHKKPIYKIVQ